MGKAKLFGPCVEDRFLSYVSRPTSGGCWDWIGGRSKDGYGAFWFNGRNEKAHRVAWVLFVNRSEILPELLVCHKCDNKACVNPGHLFLGTFQDNMKDMIQKGRQVFHGNIRGNHLTYRKLSDEQVRFIRSYLPIPGFGVTLAQKFGISINHVYRIRNDPNLWRNLQ